MKSKKTAKIFFSEFLEVKAIQPMMIHFCLQNQNLLKYGYKTLENKVSQFTYNI